MRLKAIICEVLTREVYYCAARTANVVDVEIIDKGLHNEPDELRAELQRRIDSTDPDRYDAILLAYGLCGTSTAGLRAGALPIIMPRAHDCITLYLGSKDRYQQFFTEHPGTYYYTADYIERGGSSSSTPLGTTDDGALNQTYEEYVAKYGPDNADYLMEVMGAWKAHYSRATYIDIKDVPLPDYRPQVREEAARRGWTYHETAGHSGLICKLVDGAWDKEDFLRVEPGQWIQAVYSQEIVRSVRSR